jgi:hypothetical protein
VDPCWVLDADPTPLPDFILTGFPTEIRNMAATYGSWLRQAIEAIPEPDHHATKGDWPVRCDYSRFVRMASIHSLDNRATRNNPMLNTDHGADNSNGAPLLSSTRTSTMTSWPSSLRMTIELKTTPCLYMSATWLVPKKMTATGGMTLCTQRRTQFPS